MRLAWCSDIHLNFLHPNGPRAFGESIHDEGQVDAVVVTGDIAEAPSLVSSLESFADGAKVPVHFVLGNHDYYRGAIWEVRAAMQQLKHPLLTWLDEAHPIQLDTQTALVGHEGWADAQYGNPLGSRVEVADHELIQEFAGALRHEIVSERQRMGLLYAQEAERNLLSACAGYEHIVFATHYPPFIQATWHNGRHSDEHWLPWFSCKAMGDTLLRVASNHLDKTFTVLCGHTHGEGRYRAAPNLDVYTAKAAYYVPSVYKILTF